MVPPNPQILALVSFPGAEIKDLYVHENVPPEPEFPLTTTPVIPEVKSAPTHTQHPPTQPSTRPASTVAPPAKEDNVISEPSSSVPRRAVASKDREEGKTEHPRDTNERNDRGGRGRGRDGRGGRGRDHGHGEREGRAERGRGRGRGRAGPGSTLTASDGVAVTDRSAPPPPPATLSQNTAPPRLVQPQGAAGTGEHLLRMRERQATGAVGKSNVESGTEFDFQASASGFNKSSIAAELTEQLKARIHLYKKDDFFDNISSDHTDRLEGKQTGLTPSMERKLNQDTFGAIALQSNHRRGGYRGRGGRGRGYGRGRFSHPTPAT